MAPLLLFVVLGLMGYLLWRHYKELGVLDHIPGHSSWTSLPLIGHMYVLGRTPVEVLHDHNKKYGDIFRLDSGPWPTVFLCNYEQITYTMKQDIFSARPHHLIPGFRQVWGTDEEGQLYGFALTSGKRFSEQRKIFSQYLANSKNKFDEIIGDEASLMCNQISSMVKQKGGIIEINSIFMDPVNRVLWRVVTGKPIEEETAAILTDAIRESFRISERAGFTDLLQMTTSWCAPLYKKLGYSDTILDKCLPVKNFVNEVIAGTSPHAEGNFLERHKEEIRKAKPGSSFFGQTGILNLESSIYGILLAGTDTVSAFLEWFLMYMTAFPDVQEKCNQEVEAVIGNRMATLQDRAKTHYLEAVLQEISRHCPHLALTVQHYLTADTTVGGYSIPKGTQVYYFSSSVLHNPEFFKEPSLFRPERFIDAKGEFMPDEKVIYFGTGKRRCVGEILGRAEMYIFAASFLQAFKFTSSDGKRPDHLSYRPGLNMHIKQFKVKITPRY